MPSRDDSSPLDFQSLFEASPNAYVVLDTDLTIVDANETYLQTVGREREEIIGESVFDAFPGDPHRREEPNVRRLRASLERVLSTGERDSLALLQYAIPKETEEGTEYQERFWSATHTPILGEDGSVEYILQHTADVTELYEERFYEKAPQEKALQEEAPQTDSSNTTTGEEQRAELGSEEETSTSDEDGERKLTSQQVGEGILSRAKAVQKAYWTMEEERERLRRLFHQAPSFMTFLSEPGHVFEMANEAYYQLVGHRDIIGKPVREALPEVVEQGFPKLLDRVYETGEPFVGREEEIRLQKEPGDELETAYLDFIYQPVTGPEGETTGIFVQGHDVSEKKRTKDRLRQQKAELKKLTESLEERVEERTREVRELTSQITRIEQQERKRIGQDLHDSVASQLTGANIKLNLLSGKARGDLSREEIAEKIEEVQELIQEGAEDMRRLSRGLNPGGLSEGDLSSALEVLAQSIEGARYDETPDLGKSDLSTSGLDVSDLGEEVATHMYRIAQEAVSNARRHGKASVVSIRLTQEGGTLLLEVDDDGKGFDPNEVEDGLGLRSMRRRADFLGADLQVESSPEEGTLVRCEMPIETALGAS